jgi:hypothetical protein
MSEWLEVYHILELRLRAQGTPPSNKCLSCEKCAKCAYGRARGPSSCPPPSPHSLLPSPTHPHTHTHTHKQPACVTHTHTPAKCACLGSKHLGSSMGAPKGGKGLAAVMRSEERWALRRRRRRAQELNASIVLGRLSYMAWVMRHHNRKARIVFLLNLRTPAREARSRPHEDSSSEFGY